MSVAMILVVLCGQADVACGQIGMARPLTGPTVPVGVGPISGMTLPGGTSYSRPLESNLRLNQSSLPGISTPQLQTGIVSAPRPAQSSVVQPQPVAQSVPYVVRPGAPPYGKGGEDGGGDDEKRPSGKSWVNDLPWWVWLIAVVIFLAIVDSLKK